MARRRPRYTQTKRLQRFGLVALQGHQGAGDRSLHKNTEEGLRDQQKQEATSLRKEDDYNAREYSFCRLSAVKAIPTRRKLCGFQSNPVACKTALTSSSMVRLELSIGVIQLRRGRRLPRHAMNAQHRALRPAQPEPGHRRDLRACNGMVTQAHRPFPANCSRTSTPSSPGRPRAEQAADPPIVESVDRLPRLRELASR